MIDIRLILGDALQVVRTLPSESVHCVVTSPPYWGLRDYNIEGQIGLESSFDEWVEKLVALFDEIRRVLHKSGTLWLNLGDCYAGGGRGGGGSYSPERRAWKDADKDSRSRKPSSGYKDKDLMGAPWRVAFALQDSGWYLRSDIIWHKPNPMPESVLDRPTRGHEYLFLMTKSGRYFYDKEAIADPALNAGSVVVLGENSLSKGQANGMNIEASGNGLLDSYTVASMRNKRTVWTIATEPYPDAHFATYPTALVEPCIKAGASEKGCCPSCLAPWRRLQEKGEITEHGGYRKRADAPGAETSKSSVFRTGKIQTYATIGWQPTCKCAGQEPIPCTVLDPFSGAGTTGLVAARLFRSYIGVELNPEYLEMSRKRIESDQPLFNNVHVDTELFISNY